MTFILVRPAYDPVSEIMNSWAGSDELAEHTECDLDGLVATEENLRLALRDLPNVQLVAFYGHGKPDSLLANSIDGVERTLIHVTGPGVVPRELAGRKLYAAACHSGSKLGPALAAVGCSFVGYQKDLNIAVGFEAEFGTVVNRSLVAWSTSAVTSARVGEQLRDDWLELSDSLDSRLSGGAYLWLAVLGAFWNGHRVSAY